MRVGGSGRVPNDEDAERHDLPAAIKTFTAGKNKLKIAGYSLGAELALPVAYPAIERWVVVAPPLTTFNEEDLGEFERLSTRNGH